MTFFEVNEAVEDYMHPDLRKYPGLQDGIYYACYTLDSDGDEVDHFEDFDLFEDAVSACKQETNDAHCATHICVIASDEHDPGVEDFLKYYGLISHEIIAEFSPDAGEAVEDYMHPILRKHPDLQDGIYYACYTLDEAGDEVERFDKFDNFLDAISACKQETNDDQCATHICVIASDEYDPVVKDFLKSHDLINHEIVAEFSIGAGEALTEGVEDWHGMSREEIQDFAENSSEYWAGDDSWVEGIVQWLLDCDDEAVWDVVTSDNIDEDDDTFLMDTFMASDYYNE